MNKTLLSEKFKSYAAVAGSILATAASADAQIIYTDVNPDETLPITNGSFNDYSVDFDGDSNADLAIATYGYLIQGSIQANLGMVALQPNETAAIIGYDDQGYSYVSNLAVGTFIDPASSEWLDTTALGGPSANAFAAVPSASVAYGQFLTGADGYVAARFVLGANTHYGWVRIQTSTDGTTTIVKDFAYNSAANTGLDAGETGLGINEMPASAWFAGVNGSNIIVSAKVDGKLTVVDATGRVVANGVVTNGEGIINLNDDASGIYVVSFENENSIGTKKVIIH